MRRTALVIASVMALAVATQTATGATTPVVAGQPPAKAAWSKKCKKAYPSRQSYRGITKILKNYSPFTRAEGRTVRKLVICTTSRAKTFSVKRHRDKLKAWRKRYEQKWHIEYNKLPAYEQAWAVSTSTCEAGMNPATDTGNGFLGAFQFMQSTWEMAGGTGSPTQHSWYYQAIIAVHWKWKTSDEQWPVCGD